LRASAKSIVFSDFDKSIPLVPEGMNPDDPSTPLGTSITDSTPPLFPAEDPYGSDDDLYLDEDTLAEEEFIASLPTFPKTPTGERMTEFAQPILSALSTVLDKHGDRLSDDDLVEARGALRMLSEFIRFGEQLSDAIGTTDVAMQ
jgi:hypothetical protein